MKCLTLLCKMEELGPYFLQPFQPSVSRLATQMLLFGGSHQAAKQAQQQRREHQQQQETSFVEIKNQITSDLLTENSQAAQRPQGLHRILPFYLKSKTSEQGATTRKGQKVQHHEKKAQHRAEKALDAKWGSQTTALAEAALELEEQERELCAEFRRGLGSFNQELAKEQQAQ